MEGVTSADTLCRLDSTPLLSRSQMLNEHSDHTVHLFEADTRPGGHANTVEFVKPGSPAGTPSVKVDT